MHRARLDSTRSGSTIRIQLDADATKTPESEQDLWARRSIAQ
jgi:hypothetical protein